MGKVSCPSCEKVFDSEFEYRLHWSHNHREPMPKSLSQTEPANPTVDASPVATVEEPKVQIEEHEATPEYALATSKKGLGELVPVLKDKFGNIIDGFHRKGENADWREETLDWIDTPEKLEAARLAVNYARRRMAPEEIKERITYLVSKAKMSTEQIAKLTGIAERTVRKYMPQEFKNQARVEAARLGNEARAISAACMPQIVTVPDAEIGVVGTVRTFADATAETAKAAESSFSPETQAQQTEPEVEVEFEVEILSPGAKEQPSDPEPKSLLRQIFSEPFEIWVNDTIVYSSKKACFKEA